MAERISGLDYKRMNARMRMERVSAGYESLDTFLQVMKGVTGYTFRHTIITDIYEATHDANIASAVAGHSKTSITMNRYSHARQDAAKRGMRAIDEAYDL